MMRKFINTIRICACLFMARTFGKYIHSGWDGRVHYCRYEWAGREWLIPLGAEDTEGLL